MSASKFENVTGMSSRVLPTYTEEEMKRYTLFNKAIDLKFKLLSKNNPSNKIHSNQKAIAKQIVQNFQQNNLINQMVVSPTQSGKTGIVCETIRLLINAITIPANNIYIITGLSSIEWKNQTKERIPEFFANRVFHRNDLGGKFKEDIKDKENVFIIMDEIQVASAKEQTIHKVFQELGFMNLEIIFKKDVKFLEITATPNGTIYDLMKWGDNLSSKIIVNPPKEYTSCFKLLDQDRVKQYQDYSIDSLKELKDTIDSVYSTPRYHIIRGKTAEQQDLIIEYFKDTFGDECKYITFDFNSEEEDINTILNVVPTQHVFIFIKERLRCAKSISDKKVMGIYYERFSSNPDDDVIIQGMLGRATGYNDNGDSIVYTNIDSILRYKELLESNFERTDIKWNSSSTVFKGEQLRSCNYFNTPQNIKGFTATEFERDECETPEEKKERIKREKEEKEAKKKEREILKEEKQRIKAEKEAEKLRKKQEREDKKKAKDEEKEKKKQEKESKKKTKEDKKRDNNEEKEEKEPGEQNGEQDEQGEEHDENFEEEYAVMLSKFNSIINNDYDEDTTRKELLKLRRNYHPDKGGNFELKNKLTVKLNELVETYKKEIKYEKKYENKDNENKSDMEDEQPGEKEAKKKAKEEEKEAKKKAKEEEKEAKKKAKEEEKEAKKKTKEEEKEAKKKAKEEEKEAKKKTKEEKVEKVEKKKRTIKIEEEENEEF
jgi:hypothetical protein